jgi:HAD superfamily hydrolase (TIGR01509 family)
MDGVLVDSEEFIARAAQMMFAEHGLRVKQEDFEPFVGMGENRYIGGVAEKYGFMGDIRELKRRTYDIYLEIIKGRLRPLPGVFSFISECRKKGLRLAVASSADERKVRGNLEEIGLGFDKFDAVICGEDVEHKKPASDIFLLAAKRIGVEPARCLVVEDAPSGVKAAKAAGAKCLAITSSFSRDELAGADWFAPSLEVRPDDFLG